MLNKKFEIIEEGIISRNEMKDVRGGCAFYGCPTNEPQSYNVGPCVLFHSCTNDVYHNCPMNKPSYFVCSGTYEFCTDGVYNPPIEPPILKP